MEYGSQKKQRLYFYGLVLALFVPYGHIEKLTPFLVP